MPAEPHSEEPMFAPPTTPERRDWKPMAIGLLSVAVIAVALVVIFSPRAKSARATNPNEPSVAAAYARQLPITGEKMSTADIPATGGQIYYVEGMIENTGQRTVVSATVELIFRDALGRICQREEEPLRVVVATQPALDVTDLAHARLGPGQRRDFQLPLEHISSEWNQQFPELRVVAAELR